MRHRETRTGDMLGNDATVYITPPGGSPAVWSTTKYGTETLKQIDDVVVPRFRRLLECGQFLPLNPVSIEKTVRTRTTGNVSVFLTASSSTFEGQYHDSPNLSAVTFPPLDQDKIDQAILSAASKAAAGGWDVLTFAAELGSSIDTLHQVGRGFRQAVLRTAHVARDFRRNPWKRFTELWLLGRYGIRPMVYDVIDAYEALQQVLKGPQDLITGRGFLTESLNQDFTSGWVNDGVDYNRLDTWTLRGTRTYRGVAYVKPSKLEASGIDMDLFSTAWELTPYSFVIDRFIDIGSWVNTLTPTLTGAYAGIGSSIKEEFTFDSSRTWTVKPGQGTGDWGGGNYYQNTVKYTRGPASIPFPPLLPRVDVPFLVDLAALFLGTKRDVGRILNRR